MIGFLIAILVLVGIRAAIFANGIDEKQKADFLAKKKEPHTLHKWIYHSETGKLSCEECGFVAGTHVPTGREEY